MNHSVASTGVLPNVFEFLNYGWRILLALIALSVLIKKHLSIMKTTTLILCFLLLLAMESNGQGFIVTYPQEPKAVLSDNYTVYVNEIPVSVYSVATNKDISYAHFSFAGKVSVRIHVSVAVSTYDLSPHGYDIESTKSGQDIRFELDSPRKLFLHKVNSLVENLCILADPLEAAPPKIGDAIVVNIMDKGADNTGEKNSLNRINATLAAMPAGGILYFPPGRYTAGGTISMLSNKSIYIAGGAVIQGTTASSGGELSFNFDGASNAKLFGRGSIDGNGDLKRGSYNGEGGACLIAKQPTSISNNCLIDGIIVKGAISWTAIVQGTTNWTVFNVKIINGAKFGNHDGWDPHNAINMMFDNNFIHGSDDCIAMSTTKKNLNLNTTFRNNVFINLHSGATIRIGPWIGDGTSNIRAENNDHIISGTNEYALAFWIGGNISNIKYVGERVENAQFGLILMRTNWNDHYAGLQDGSVDGILFDRLTVEKVSPCTWDGHLSQLEGPNATNFVKNISFRDFYQRGKLMTSASAADLNFKGPNVSNVTFDTSTTPVIDIKAASLMAYRNGSNTGKFTISRTGGSTVEPLTVKYVIHGTAINGMDYTAIPDSVVIPSGSETTDIIITPDPTNTADYYKTVVISLSSHVDYILGPDFHSVVTVSNNSVADIDNQLPSTPTNLDSSAVTANGFRLNWAASTDNIGIATYQIFRNGVYIAATSDTSYMVTGLSSPTDYEFTVKAWDNSGNASGLSTALKVSTLSTGIPESYLNQLSVYPNPVVDHTLIVDFKNTIHAKEANIQITNMNGRVEYETTIPAMGKSTIHLPDSLVKGIYIISIKADKISTSNTIVIE